MLVCQLFWAVTCSSRRHVLVEGDVHGVLDEVPHDFDAAPVFSAVAFAASASACAFCCSRPV
jgi:hypothetical protein